MALLSVSSNNNEQVVWGECAKAAESNPTVSRSPNSKPRRSRIPNRGRTCWSTAGVNGPMHRQNWCADIQICDSLHTLESLPLCHWSALPSCGHTTMSKYSATTLCVYICLCVWQRETDRQRDGSVGSSHPISVSQLPHEMQTRRKEGVVWGSMVTHILASTTPPEASHYVRLHNHPRDQSYMIPIHHIKRPRLLL